MAIKLTRAMAVTANRVRAWFSEAPLAKSVLGLGDILNPETCAISSPGQSFYTILVVDPVSDTVFDFTILEPMEGYRVTHTLSIVDLVDAALGLAPDPSFISTRFAGLQDGAVAPDPASNIRDVSNPPVGTNILPGTLKIVGGDYSNDTGAALIKKLVIRRIITPKGGFFHLPNYGLGFQVKKPIGVGSIAQRKVELQNQIYREPEVASVSVQISVGTGSSTGVTTIFSDIKLKNGTPITIALGG